MFNYILKAELKANKVVEWIKNILLNITKTRFKIDRTLQFNHTK